MEQPTSTGSNFCTISLLCCRFRDTRWIHLFLCATTFFFIGFLHHRKLVSSASNTVHCAIVVSANIMVQAAFFQVNCHPSMWLSIHLILLNSYTNLNCSNLVIFGCCRIKLMPNNYPIPFGTTNQEVSECHIK